MSGDGYRDFRGRVALIGLLRVFHVIGVVGLGAAVTAGHTAAQSGVFLPLLAVSGVAVALLDRWSNRAFFRQVGGLAVLLKAALLAGLAAAAAFGAAAFWGFLVFSVAIAHAPGRVRHRRVL
ncbi:MAG: hypothetical protein A2045_10550 [Rhodocyclales bacterium GWA2_65_20]|nr:MAG: hypothetical protein A2045_10550 [Rhodocyclales bacterium GWA2_65_20]